MKNLQNMRNKTFKIDSLNFTHPPVQTFQSWELG